MSRVACLLAILIMLLVAPLAPVSGSEHDEEDDPDTSGTGNADDRDRREDDLDEDDEREDADRDEDEGEDEDEEDDDDDFEDDDDGFRVRGSNVRFSNTTSGFQIQRTDRSLNHQFVELIEFRDADGDGRYDAGETVLVRHDLQRTPDAITQTRDTRTITYRLPQGELDLVVRGLGEDTKFDVVIHNHTYQATDTRVALVSSLVIEGGIQATHVNDEPAVAGAGTGDVPYLSWVTHVDTDEGPGRVAWSVLASLSADDATALVYWAYPQSANITHDPVLGVIHLDVATLADTPVLVASIAGAVAVVALGYVARRRTP